MTLNILGVDPGPATGIVTLHWARREDRQPRVHAYQCDAGSAPRLLGLLLGEFAGTWTAGGIEKYVASHLPDSPVTRGLVAELRAVAAERGLALTARRMTDVKPWANDSRMKKSGLWGAIPAKMVDARAAGRHALISAVQAGMPDPLSRKAQAGHDR